MNQKIGMTVQTQLDTSGVEQKLNALGQKIASLNKVQFKPFSGSTTADLKKMDDGFKSLLKINGDLNKRMKETGQAGASLLTANWDKLYSDPNSRARQMRKAFEYSTGATFSAIPGAPSQGGGDGGSRKPNNGPTAGGTAVKVAQAGLRAAGPVGGVAASALGTGASAGFGAGLMGLMGGMLALGVGKLVGSAMEKVTQAENNSIALDTLKRTLGDVNVSFDALKSVVDAGAQNLKITYDESVKLSTQFAKLGNLSNDQYKSIAGELDVGVGMSRAFGLDPSQGVGVMGQMRGLGVTTNTQESRRFALLIGETIGKAGAFAKADEMMDAVAGFASSQTRNNLGVANSAGYAGMLSGLVGSGAAGLDVSNSAAILARVNATLSGGGGAGEASQFFTGMVGHRMGLDPIQTQILSEGGAFATNESMFGDGSAAKAFGLGGPGGDKTFLQGTMEMLREKYGNNKGMLAQATSRHLGVGINQAMRLLSIDPNEMGEMQNFGDVSKLSGSGIANLSKSLYGTDSDRQGIAQTLLGRKDVSQEDKAKIEAAMGTSKEREVLATLTAQYDQERTQGSDIRDSKNALDNIKVDMAGKVVPYLNEMRMGIMHLAGYDKGKTSEQIMKEVIARDSEGRARSIAGRFASITDPLQERQQYLRNKERSLDPAALSHTYRDNPEVLASKMKEREDVQRELGEIDKKLKDLGEEKAGLLKKENARRDAEIKQMEKDAADRATEALTTGSLPSSTGDFSRMDRGQAGGGGGAGGRYFRTSGGSVKPADKASTDEAMRFFMGKGWTEEQAAGIVANFTAESQLNHGAVGDGGKAYGVAQWHPDRQADFRAKYGKDIRESTRREQYEFAHYEMTDGRERGAGSRLRGAKTKAEAAGIVSEYYERPKLNENAKRGALAERIGTPLPESGPNYRPGAVQSAPLPPLTGEMSLRLDMGPGLAGLIRPKGPMSTTFGPARAQ